MNRFRKIQTLFDDYYEMLADEVRMSAYVRAINQVVRPGDIVIDMGAGLGILSFLAVKAGAARVYAIEKSDSIELAMHVAEENGMADRIEFLDALSKEVVLGELERPADVLLSETLGSFGVDENTLDFTIDVRDRLLAPDARLLPRALRMWLAPVSSPKEYARLQFWTDVHGVDYSAAIDEILSRMVIVDIDEPQLLAEPLVYDHIDLATVESPSIERALRFEIAREGQIHGLAGWFEAELCEGVMIETSPDVPTTHWKQALFPFRTGIDVIPGDVLDVVLRVGPKAPDSDDTTISYEYLCTQIAGDED